MQCQYFSHQTGHVNYCVLALLLLLLLLRSALPPTRAGPWMMQQPWSTAQLLLASNAQLLPLSL
jgi:hypothetical protein